MTEKISQNPPLGYFKVKVVKPKLPDRSSVLRSIFSADRRLTEMLQQSKPVIVVPVIGFTLAILLLTGVQTGVVVANRIPNDFFAQTLVDSGLTATLGRYQALTMITLPASVSFLMPIYDQGVEKWNSFQQSFSAWWLKMITKLVSLGILTESLSVE